MEDTNKIKSQATGYSSYSKDKRRLFNEGLDKYDTLKNNQPINQPIQSINQSINGEKTKELYNYFLSLSVPELVNAFEQIGLVNNQWVFWHERKVKIIGKEKYVRMGLHCRNHGKDGGGKLFTWNIREELK